MMTSVSELNREDDQTRRGNCNPFCEALFEQMQQISLAENSPLSFLPPSFVSISFSLFYLANKFSTLHYRVHDRPRAPLVDGAATLKAYATHAPETRE